jgi:hypothetical protein
MSLRKLPTRSRTFDAEYGYCVLEVAAVAVATVVSDAVEALSRLIGAVVVEVAGSDVSPFVKFISSYSIKTYPKSKVLTMKTLIAVNQRRRLETYGLWQ